MACYPGQPLLDLETGDLLSPSDPEQDYDDSVPLKPHSTQYTISWLNNNYHYEDGVCLPRSSIYEHYLDFCARDQLQPINAASFGKIIRQQFPSLTTRRLGTRGQSKYHYFGLGIKPSSLYYTEEYVMNKQNLGVARKEPDSKKTHPYYTPKEKPSAVLPPFPEVKYLNLPEGVPREKLHTFMVMYRAHCQRILDSVVRANFEDVEAFLLHFWQGLPTHLISLLPSQVAADLVALCDSTLYHVITNVLIVSPLQSLPESIAQEVRKFSSQLKCWVNTAMEGMPEPLREAKCKVASIFTKSLKRQTSLMHLAQAARNALRNDESLVQLRKDWSGLDLSAVFAHTLYAITPLDIPDKYLMMVPEFVQEFAMTVHDKRTVEDFVMWMEDLMTKCVHQYTVQDYCTLKRTGRTFLLTWKFFTSKIVREFTLQSAPSFGTFHLLHVLLEDYIAHVLESILDKEQERVYSERIGALKQDDQSDGADETEELSPTAHQLHVAHSTAEPTALNHPTDFTVTQDAQHLHLPINARSNLPSLSPGPPPESLHAASAALPSTAVSAVNLASVLSTSTPSPVTSPHLSTSCHVGLSHGQTSRLLADRTVSGLPQGAPMQTVGAGEKQQLGGIIPTQPAFPGNLPPSSLAGLQPPSHHHSLMFGSAAPPPLPPSLLGGGATLPPGHGEGLLPLPRQQHGGIGQPGSISLPMPLSHTGIPSSFSTPLPHNGTGGGLPLLPTMPPGLYPYASYGGIPQMLQPVPPSSTGMLRVSASPFPTQSLVSGYPSYIPPSLYSTNTSQIASTTDFTR